MSSAPAGARSNPIKPEASVGNDFRISGETQHMSTKAVAQRNALQDALTLMNTQYGCGSVQFAGTDDALYEPHLLFDLLRLL